MEDFEYSVDICDRSWSAFVADIEECNLLPPSLAGLDDSGMSDIDDKVRFVQKAELEAAFSEVDPPGCASSPADRYISKYGVTGMESILSGSEEDIHLQCVNVFFERLKSASEAEKLADPNQTRAPTQREVKEESGHRSDGQQANNGALTENIPSVNFLAATSEAAAAETTELNNSSSTVKTERTDECVSTTPAGSSAENKTFDPVQPGAELKHPHGTSDPELELEVEDPPTPLNVAGMELFPPSKGFSNASQSHLDVKWKKDSNASLTDSTDPRQTESRESSPSSSARRKRTRKRRLELAERQGVVKPSDSEDEQQARRGWLGARGVAEDNHLYALKIPQRHATSSEYSSLHRLPVSLSAREIKVNDLADPKGAHRHSESNFRQSRINGARLTGNSAANNQFVIPLNPTVMSALNPSSQLATRFHPGGHLRIDKEMIHIFCCESEQRCGSHKDQRPPADSLLHEEAGNSGLQCHCTLTDQCGSRPRRSPPSLSRPDSPSTQSNHTERTKSALDDFNSLPGGLRPSPHPPVSEENIPVPPPEHPVLLPVSDLEVVSGGSTVAEGPKIPPSVPARPQKSEHSCTSLSDFSPVSSCCTLYSESGMSLSNGNITDLSYASSLSVCRNDSRCSEGKTSPTKREEEDSLAPEADGVAPSPEVEEEPELLPDSTHSVFAMSSFWSEMEKLTINDILGLRQMEQTASQSSLPPSKGGEKPAEFALTDSGLYSDELNPELPTVPVPSEGEAVPVHQSADTLAVPAGKGFASGSGQTSFRRMCKTVSVQNLRTLECVRQKDQPLKILDEEDLEKVGCFPNGPVSNKEDDSYSISLGGIFQYLFGKQPHPQGYHGSSSSFHADGRSLPETYDQFMSDWNMEGIFHPFLAAPDRANDGSRSAGGTLHFPEASENFFAPSSSDESAAESDEDASGAAWAAGRLRRASNASDNSTDIYDNFFTDCDFEQSFSWKSTFSFRNLLFSGSTEKQQTVSGSFVPQRPSGFQITANPVHALKNQECMFSDLYPAKVGRPDMQPQHPFTYEDLQVAVPSPSESSCITPHHTRPIIHF